MPAAYDVAYVPLDDRPCNARDPVILARLAGASIAVPPRAWLGRFTAPGDHRRILRWLIGQGARATRRVVSLDMLGSGGLVASREAVPGQVCARTRFLEEIARGSWSGGGGTSAFLVLLRPSITVKREADLDVWRGMFDALSRVDRAPKRAPSGVPPAAFRAHLAARAQQLELARAAIREHARGAFDRLVFFQEDCRSGGLPRHEQAQLAADARMFGVDPDALAIQPGADEAGMLLVARSVLGDRPGPKVRVVWGEDGLDAWTAPYEDRPLRETVRSKLATAGAREVSRHEDVVLYVHGTPGPPRDGFAGASRAHTQDGDAQDACAGDRAILPPPLPAPLSPRLPPRLARIIRAGRAVGVADVLVANAADSGLVRALLAEGVVGRLWSYAAWNTAANTIGSVVAHIVALWCSRSPHPLSAPEHVHFLAHRFLEDYVYATLVRPALAVEFSPHGWDAFADAGAAPEVGTGTRAGTSAGAAVGVGISQGDRALLCGGALGSSGAIQADRILRSMVGEEALAVTAALGLKVAGVGRKGGARLLWAHLPWGRIFEAEVCPYACGSRRARVAIKAGEQ